MTELTGCSHSSLCLQWCCSGHRQDEQWRMSSAMGTGASVLSVYKLQLFSHTRNDSVSLTNTASGGGWVIGRQPFCLQPQAYSPVLLSLSIPLFYFSTSRFLYFPLAISRSAWKGRALHCTSRSHLHLKLRLRTPTHAVGGVCASVYVRGRRRST